MATATSEPDSYRDLCRNNVRLKTVLGADDLPRLRALTESIGSVTVTLQFSQPDGRPCAQGNFEAALTVHCNLCSKPDAGQLSGTFRLLLAQDEATADRWLEESRSGTEHALPDIAVVGRRLDAAELIEDELMLSLPARFCNPGQCKNAPEMQYPHGDTAEEDTVQGGAFAMLRQLKTHSGDSDP